MMCVETERDDLRRELEKVKGVLGRVVSERAAKGVQAGWSRAPGVERTPDGMDVRVLDLGIHTCGREDTRGRTGEKTKLSIAYLRRLWVELAINGEEDQPCP